MVLRKKFQVVCLSVVLVLSGMSFSAAIEGAEVARVAYAAESSAHASLGIGWQKVDGKWFYYGEDGSPCVGWKKVDGAWYYLDDSGVMATGWKKVAGAWYYLDGAGVMRTGWMKVGGAWYYLDGAGVMRTGWTKVSGAWYYLDGDGVMRTGWTKAGGAWYYLYGAGVMASSKWIGDYYVEGSGAMAVSKWIGSKYVGADGKWVRGKTKPGSGSSSASKPSTSTVYWVSGGSVYHTTKDCVSLKRSKGIKSGTVAQSGKKRVCSNCG